MYEQIIDQDIDIKRNERQDHMHWKTHSKTKEGFKNNFKVHQAILFELLQNAIDCAIQTKQKEVRINIDRPGRDLSFTHDVGFFTLDNMFSLLWGDSDKFDVVGCKTIGQFGRGMWLTSLLSQKRQFVMSGQLQNPRTLKLLDFSILIDKSIDNEQQYLQHIKEQEQKLKSCPISIQTKQHTSVRYIDVDDKIYQQTKNYFFKHLPLTSYFLEIELGINIWINNERVTSCCKDWVYLKPYSIVITKGQDDYDVNAFIIFPITSKSDMIPEGWIINDRQFVPDDKRDILQTNNNINIQQVESNISNALTSMMTWNGDWELISQSLIFSFKLEVYANYKNKIKALFPFMVLRVDGELKKLNELLWMNQHIELCDYLLKFYIMANYKTNERIREINNLIGLPIRIFNIQDLCSKLNQKQRLRLAMDYPNRMSSEDLEIQCWNVLLQIKLFRDTIRCLPIQNGDLVQIKQLIRQNNKLQRFIQSSIPNTTLIHEQIQTDYLIDKFNNYFSEFTMEQTITLFEKNINLIKYESYLSHPINKKYCSPQLESFIEQNQQQHERSLKTFREQINNRFILELFERSYKQCPILIQQKDLIEYIHFQDIDKEFLKCHSLFFNICDDLIKEYGIPIELKSQSVNVNKIEIILIQRFQKLIYNFYPIPSDLKQGDIQVLCFYNDDKGLNIESIAVLCIYYLDEQEINQLNHQQLEELINILKLFQKIEVVNKKKKNYYKKLKSILSEAYRYLNRNFNEDGQTEIQFIFRIHNFIDIPYHVIQTARNFKGFSQMQVHCFNPMDQQNNQKLYDTMITMINSSQISIDIAMMHISDPDITNCLIHAAKRLGIGFRFVFDVYQYHTSGSLAHYITQIPTIQSRCQDLVKDIEAWKRIQQHTKIVIVDRKYVFFGSMNLSSPAIRPVDSKHSEIIVFDRYTDRYQEVFEQIWNQPCYQYTPKSLNEFQKVNAQVINNLSIYY